MIIHVSRSDIIMVWISLGVAACLLQLAAAISLVNPVAAYKQTNNQKGRTAPPNEKTASQNLNALHHQTPTAPYHPTTAPYHQKTALYHQTTAKYLPKTKDSHRETTGITRTHHRKECEQKCPPGLAGPQGKAQITCTSIHACSVACNVLIAIRVHAEGNIFVLRQ